MPSSSRLLLVLSSRNTVEICKVMFCKGTNKPYLGYLPGIYPSEELL